MRTIFFILYAVITLSLDAQVKKNAMVLPDYLIPNQGVVHTVKVNVTNNCDIYKIIYLRNDKEITGIDLTGADFTNPISIITEYGESLYIDLETWVQVPFSTWFKNMRPKSTFTFYFYSNRHIDTEQLLNLIRISNNDLSFKTQAMEDLGWNADEIVIYLPM